MATVVVLLVVGLFVNLGLWQLRRSSEQRLANVVGATRYEAPAGDLIEMVSSSGPSIDSLEWRRATVRGEYRADSEVLVRSSVRRGRAGFRVLTPLDVAGDERTVIVDRGWVPLEFDDPPVPAAPAEGVVEVSGIVRLGEQRPAIGAVDDPPPNAVVSRVDPAWMEDAIGEPVLPVWIQISGESERLPIPAEVPLFDDAGPHLLYAIQWFAFALIGTVGYGFLVRSHLRRAEPSR